MKNYRFFLSILSFIGGIVVVLFILSHIRKESDTTTLQARQHWLLLYRKSSKEFLYFGEPDEIDKSTLIKTFTVKTGIPSERPTPLPQLVGRKYWLITRKQKVIDNPETAPYFLTLNIPAPTVPPYGPSPYLECDGQCDWVTFGEFGLHGINGDLSRLSSENKGSSGCIRHTDEDITYLYNLLDPSKKEIKYYIQDI